MPESTPLPEGFLSPYFTLDELTYSDTAIAECIDNSPDADATEQLSLLANDTLEGIRELCGDHAVYISSGYRCPQLNEAVGGASNSAHKYGCAADIEVPDFGDPLTVCCAIKPWLAQLGIDQLIYETSSDGGVWAHVGRAIPGDGAPRGQCFSIINGATVYEPFPGP